MKIRFLLALVGLAISFTVPSFAQQTNTPDPQLRQQLDAFDKKNDEAFNNNDAAAVAALFTEDAVLVTDRGPVYGREAIEKYYADAFKKFHFKRVCGHLVPERFPRRILIGVGRKGDNKEVSFDRAILFELFMIPLQMRGMQETKEFDLGLSNKCSAPISAADR